MILEVLRKDLNVPQKEVLNMNIVAALNHLMFINDLKKVEEEEAKLRNGI